LLRIRITKDEEESHGRLGIWLTLSGSVIARRSQPSNFVFTNYVCLGIQFMKVPVLPVVSCALFNHAQSVRSLFNMNGVKYDSYI